MKDNPNKWDIVAAFKEHDIQCYVMKWTFGITEDRQHARFGEEGFYQYNGYCVLPLGHPDRGVISESEYNFLKTQLKRPEMIAYFIPGDPWAYNVHGGITYRRWGYGSSNAAYVSTQHWLIGFDTGHYGDSAQDYNIGGYKKDERYVKQETQWLATQIRDTMVITNER